MSDFYGDRSLEFDVALVIGDRAAVLEEIVCENVARWHDDLNNALAGEYIDEEDRPAVQERLDACSVFLDKISELRGRPLAEYRAKLDEWYERQMKQPA